MEIVRDIELEPLGEAEADWTSDGTFSTAVPELPDDFVSIELFEAGPDQDDEFVRSVRALIAAVNSD